MKRLQIKSHKFNLQGVERQLSLFLMFSIFILGFCYIYFVLSSIHLVVERKNLEESKTLLSVEISELAVNYISSQETITKNQAGELGLIDSNKKTLYATRQQDSLTLTLLSDDDIEQ